MCSRGARGLSAPSRDLDLVELAWLFIGDGRCTIVSLVGAIAPVAENVRPLHVFWQEEVVSHLVQAHPQNWHIY